MPKLRCPNDPDHEYFETTAHVMEAWKVNADGEWCETIESLEVTHGPDFDHNSVTCCECGADAEVED